jgi:hypothetical protein
MDCGRIEGMTKAYIEMGVEPLEIVAQFVEQLSEEEVISLVMSMDLMMASTEFTEKLIKKLKKSLKNEFRGM